MYNILSIGKASVFVMPCFISLPLQSGMEILVSGIVQSFDFEKGLFLLGPINQFITE
jgi:hypothetical protein